MARPPAGIVRPGLREAGDIVGLSVAADGTTRGALWRDDVVIELGVLTGMTSSVARAINDKGDVVGASGMHAVRWTIAPVRERTAPR